MKPIFLASDLLIYFLVVCLSVFILSMRKNEITRNKWRRVFSQKLGMSTFIIILTYVSIAFLDSMHFRKALPVSENQPQGQVYYSNDVNSVLDLLLNEMGDRQERTYSGPFALKGWSKENIPQDDGTVIRDYPILENAGVHLESPDDLAGDLFLQSFIGLAKGLFVGLLLCLVMYLLFNRKGKRSALPWKTAMTTLLIIFGLLGWLVQMGSLYHVLGTDMAGNDTLYESLKGVRTGVLIGTLATMLTIPIAIVLGISAGYFKGRVDDVVQYIYITLSSIPGILLIAALVLLFQVWINNNPDFFEIALEKGDAKFLALCFILGITSWASLCRLLRAETLKISQLDYVNAAHAFGVRNVNILRKHILPNLTHIILISFVLEFSALILAEAVLAYIGVGIDPSMASWGNMINLSRAELSREPAVWWNLMGAFTMMFTLVLSTNLFSDLVNDAFNPKGQLEVA